MEVTQRMTKRFLSILITACMLFSMIAAAIPYVFAYDDGYTKDEHRQLALEAVREGIVLLKNKNSALPLKQSEKIAIFGQGQIVANTSSGYSSSGYILGGGGSGWVNIAQKPDSPADTLKKGGADVYSALTEAYRSNLNYVPDEAMYNAAAAYADTAIMFITRTSGEGSDLSATAWYLTDAERTMLKTISSKFDKVIVLLNTPSIIGTEWSIDGALYNSADDGIDVDALLTCYMGGEMGPQGIADILLGAANPSGKLSDTYAMDLYDYPSTDTFLESNDYVNYEEDIYVGYRYFETLAKDKVAYPFGFGLSYTSFDIITNSVSVDGTTVKVNVTVTNTGNVAGKEVVQVYYSAPNAGEGNAVLSKSAIALGAYKKTKLLSPSESQTLELTYSVYDMASFDDTGATGNRSCYVLEAGEYDILVGNSVRNAKKQGSYTVDTLTVTEELTAYCVTTLAKRLLWNGEYEIFPERNKINYVNVSSLMPTWIEAENATYYTAGVKNEPSNNAADIGGYLLDKNGIYQKIGLYYSLGSFNNVTENVEMIYDLSVDKAGYYDLAILMANSKSGGSDVTDALTVSYSIDNGHTFTEYDFKADAKNTRGDGTTSSKWFNLYFNNKNLDGTPYRLYLPKGNVRLRIAETDLATTTTAMNLDKIVLTPTDYTLGIDEVFKIYEGTVVSSTVPTWIEAEAAVSNSSVLIKETCAETEGYIYNGNSWVNIGSFTSFGKFDQATAGEVIFDLTVENAGNYNLALVMANSKAISGVTQADQADALKVFYSVDDCNSWTELVSLDAKNTRDASGATTKWYNLYYNDRTLDGDAYKVTLPSGKVFLKIVENTANEAKTAINLDKLVLLPASQIYDIEEVAKYYGAPIAADKSIVIEAENATSSSSGLASDTNTGATGTDVRSQYSYLYDGNNYYNIGVTTSLGHFDQANNAEVVYDVNVGTAGTYNFGAIFANTKSGGSDVADALTVSYSTDGGNTYTTAFTIDAKNNREVGTPTPWFNFYYNNADLDGNAYKITLPAGNVKLKLTETDVAANTAISIDKIILSPTADPYSMSEVFNLYNITIVDNLGFSWIEAEDYSTCYSENKWEGAPATLKQEYTGTNKVALNSKGEWNKTEDEWMPLDPLTVLSNYSNVLNAYSTYDILVQKEGRYNLGLVMGNSKSGGADVTDAVLVYYSTDDGNTWRELSFKPDAKNTRTGITGLSTTGTYFNMYFNNGDGNGSYMIDLPKGKIKLKIAENPATEDTSALCFDKFALIPDSFSHDLTEAIRHYNASVIDEKAPTWIEAEDCYDRSTYYQGGTDLVLESSDFMFLDGDSWVVAPSQTAITHVQWVKNFHITYDLWVNKAGYYGLGLVVANSSTSDVSDAFKLELSSDGGSSWTVVDDFTVDVKSTRNIVDGGVNYKWYNFIYTDLSDYSFMLPAGSVKIKLSAKDHIFETYGLNIDKIVIIPSGSDSSSDDVLNIYDGKDPNAKIDLDKDQYIGITYKDVVAGKATLEELIAQMSYNELIELCYGSSTSATGITDGTGYIGFKTTATAEKYGIYSADTADGPAGLRLNNTASESTFFPCTTLQACTWNTELLADIGEAIGKECLKFNADIWLAPGMNIHRNPLGGRNFEYYSEDPLVTGKSGAAVVKGVQSTGVATTIKHFSANNKETNRKLSDSRISEKALREIYLKGFEIAVKESNPMCIMTSYNMINGIYTSANADLLIGILRGEWNYDGLVMSDWNTTPTITDEIKATNNVTMPYGENYVLAQAIADGTLSRKTLEENAAYIIGTLVKCPDHTIHANGRIDVSDSETTTFDAIDFSHRSLISKFELAGNKLASAAMNTADENGLYGFLEFTLNVDAEGTYDFDLLFSARAENNTDVFNVIVNGENVSNVNNDLSITDSWSTYAWHDVTDSLFLKQGENVIRIQHTTSRGANYCSFRLTPVDIHIHSYEGYSGDGDMHWKECVLNNCPNKEGSRIDIAEHSGGSANCENTAVCDVCKLAYGAKDKDNHAKLNKYGYCEACQIKLVGQSVNIGDDLSMKYFVDIYDETLIENSSFYMLFFVNEKQIRVDATTPNENGRYTFILSGITPQQIGDEIDAYVYVGNNVAAEKLDYSIETNLINLLNDPKNKDNATLIQLINDMLVYGKTTQEYRKYKLNDIIADEIKLTPSNTTPTDDSFTGPVNNNKYDYHIVSAGVRFDTVNSIYAIFHIPNDQLQNIVVEKNGNAKSYSLEDLTDLGDGYYRLDTDGIAPTDFDSDHTIRLVIDNDKQVYMDYCINDYCYTIANGMNYSNSDKALVLALYRYGTSAEAYAVAHM